MIDKEAQNCHCHSNLCQQIVCTRQEVINLALGFTEDFRCIHCLAKDLEASGDTLALLMRMKDYVSSRPCFAKEWQKYTDQKQCPSPGTCYPAQCFSEESSL
ncbi:MAG: hypothetical protein SFY67_16680 [Candidatus Melainabacteria bacterium]|nr:hypothetical protein [Candidatus Melainabacteria bacterium]